MKIGGFGLKKIKKLIGMNNKEHALGSATWLVEEAIVNL